MPVGELLARISSRELTEWQAYFSLAGPIGEQRADWRAGMIASTIANVNRDPKRRPEPYTPEDFIPQFGEKESSEQAMQNQIEFAKTLAARLGGTWTEDYGHPG